MKRTSPARTETNSRKRKYNFVELPVNDPLPSDREQCLNLQSGRMCYLNRRTLTKMWNRPYKEQKLDLELSIMPAISKKSVEKTDEKQVYSDDSSLIAIVCVNCHLLVMLYRSSPFCPNCRHMYSLPTTKPLKASSLSGFFSWTFAPRALRLLPVRTSQEPTQADPSLRLRWFGQDLKPPLSLPSLLPIREPHSSRSSLPLSLLSSHDSDEALPLLRSNQARTDVESPL
ncbi:hypothetical protein IEQ34_011355 [Dendrobium chrysotoxum]|uniref:Uncharacterized protein n=1 Tax=Dendrobium chrysotoxum TaxID=161865 RepID=A0AAV7GW35_DENCH|nr:hypothetical protein IEQ34_011355 [Dendrobium chrysotoxum]